MIIYRQQLRCPPCSVGKLCKSKHECPNINRKIEKLTSLQTQHNSSKYNGLLRSIKSRICNKQKRLFCCSPELVTTHSAEESGIYLPPLEKCGTTQNAANVIGGETTTPGEFPFTVLLGYNDKCIKRVRVKGRWSTKKVDCIKFKCGGTLINKRYVIIAAHCHKRSGTKKIAQAGLLLTLIYLGF